MSEELAALFGVYAIGSVKPMVKPHIPFSLFDFKFIESWGSKRFTASAGAGAAIAEVLYTCPDNKIVLILAANLYTQKTTGTAVVLKVRRKLSAIASAVPELELIAEDSINNTNFGWPSSKPATGNQPVAWHLLFLFPGDQLYLTHALTAAETIDDEVHIDCIIYQDPRLITP